MTCDAECRVSNRSMMRQSDQHALLARLRFANLAECTAQGPSDTEANGVLLSLVTGRRSTVSQPLRCPKGNRAVFRSSRWDG